MSELKLIWKPSVYVIGRQTVDREAVARFLADTGYAGPPLDYSPSEAENLVELSGRLCYRSYGKGRSHDDYIRHILEVRHGSVAEHAVWTLLIAGISRTLSHELIRHRAGISPSQESQRYVDASDVAFVVPPALASEVKVALDVLGDQEPGYWRDWTPASQQGLSGGQIVHGLGWLDSVAHSRRDYQNLATYLDDPTAFGAPQQGAPAHTRKQAREAARSILPGCAETRIALTGNARAWRNLIELRASTAADAEIRRLANAILDALQPEAPNLFGDYQRTPLPDGTFAVGTPNPKV